MITHIIYHIPGRKVGCTNNIKHRLRVYEIYEGSIPDIQVLEELHNKTDQEAGDIEWQWADKFGYKRGNHYTVRSGFKSGAAGRIGGRIAGRKRMNSMSLEERLEFASKATRRLTPEQRSANGRKGGKIGGLLRAASGTTSFHVQCICPHCKVEGQEANMHRWYFDNCKMKGLDK